MQASHGALQLSLVRSLFQHSFNGHPGQKVTFDQDSMQACCVRAGLSHQQTQQLLEAMTSQQVKDKLKVQHSITKQQPKDQMSVL